ncbi:helix-turn-helix domain-containing protein [Proteiniphilum sp.]|uniref:helix-turn-helix domain-containing protein n=1 Tax=Proteiniphilum sp. TaxID=1926877 RepID=UPI00331AC159
MKEKATDVHTSVHTNIYSIKDFTMVDSEDILDDLSEDPVFIFDGIVFGICLKGNCLFKLNHKEIQIERDYVLTILPKQIIRLLDRSSDFHCKLLFFPYNIILQFPHSLRYDFLFRLNQNPGIKMPTDKMGSILKLHSLMTENHNKSGGPFQWKITASLLQALMLMVISEYENENYRLSSVEKSRQEGLAEQFFKLLVVNFKKEKTVTFYANELCLTPKYLSTVIKKVTGRPVMDWIHEILIIGIKQELVSTHRTMLEISEEYNFPNPSFFSSFFKQHTGKTPIEYRKRNL